MHAVRHPAVAGSFYPADPATLRRQIDGFLDEARTSVEADLPAPKAITAPHAGYVYSGSTAALAYADAERRRDEVRRVVLLGPCHRVATRGLKLPGARAFRTPLGDVPVAAVGGLPHVATSPDVHLLEHSLEVHVPFLQVILDSPGSSPRGRRRAPAVVADVIEALWAAPRRSSS